MLFVRSASNARLTSVSREKLNWPRSLEPASTLSQTKREHVMRFTLFKSHQGHQDLSSCACLFSFTQERHVTFQKTKGTTLVFTRNCVLCSSAFFPRRSHCHQGPLRMLSPWQKGPLPGFKNLPSSARVCFQKKATFSKKA